MKKKSLATPFDHIPITANFDETYYNFEDHQKLGSGAQGCVFKVVRRDDEEKKVLAAKKFHKNVSDVYKREKIAYKKLPKNDLLGQCIESYDEGDKKYLVLKMINGMNLEKKIYRDSTKESYNTFDINQIMKWAV